MFRTLKKYSQDILPKAINNKIDVNQYTFNPSFTSAQGFNYFTIRQYDHQLGEIISHLYIWNNKDEVVTINLAEFFLNHLDIKKVADPKLFTMDGVAYGTFNTGYVEEGTNDIVLFRLENFEIKDYHFCEYPLRQRVEKNWAFFKEKGVLCALYGLNPITILKPSKSYDNKIVFDLVKSRETGLDNITLGTPLINDNGLGYFIAHKKIYLRGKRIYIGIPFRLDLETLEVKQSSNSLIDSFRSLFGDKHKFNRNLLSCSYFSGITFQNEDVVLGYGINDVSFNIVKINKSKLWQ